METSKYLYPTTVLDINIGANALEYVKLKLAQ